MDKESFYISMFNSKRIGDDGAVVDGWVYSSDAFCEDIHFKRSWMSLESIAQKAMLVNLSDAIAMNAKPRYALITIAIPKGFTKEQLKALASGFQKEAQRWGVEIVGGDTVASSKLDISITLISQAKRPIRRTPLKSGYLIGYTGELGRVKRDLQRLLRGGRVSKRSKFITPTLRALFMERSARILQAAMDISDGLFDDLAKLAKLNRKGFAFLKKIDKRVGCSGEEYELLFAVAPKDVEALKRRAKMSRTRVTFIAKVVRGAFRNLCKPNHF